MIKVIMFFKIIYRKTAVLSKISTFTYVDCPLNLINVSQVNFCICPWMETSVTGQALWAGVETHPQDTLPQTSSVWIKLSTVPLSSLAMSAFQSAHLHGQSGALMKGSFKPHISRANDR